MVAKAHPREIVELRRIIEQSIIQIAQEVHRRNEIAKKRPYQNVASVAVLGADLESLYRLHNQCEYHPRGEKKMRETVREELRKIYYENPLLSRTMTWMPANAELKRKLGI